MIEGAPAFTAKRVAAYRLSFGRVLTDYGQPALDEALARDVAGAEEPDLTSRMASYLRARTAFFDRVTVNAIAAGVHQLVTVGAGYDGRAWRYAKPGVHWWELDHPATQQDKRARVERLGLPSAPVSFVAWDLREAGLARALIASGLDPSMPSMFLCEGVAVYLEMSVLVATLKELRSIAGAGSRLAVSVGTMASSPEHAERRAGFRTAVAAVGEPALNSISAEDAVPILTEAGWRVDPASERAERAGFLLAGPD